MRKINVATGIALALAAPVIGAAPALADESRTYEGTVTEIVDGDSIRVSGIAGSVRLIGVHAPHPGGCYWEESKNFAADQLLGRGVTLRTDSVNDQSDHRLFAYVYVDGELYNQKTIRQGYTRERSYGPDYELRSDFREAQRQAKAEDLGRWHDC
ncbi:thermonuclease family protein [Modestobacter sp. I12A-02662]|uniref:thermonuclease family protein n=1 Tax=Modestobacter sp. I12A-02662 TaxID=1730496 RepID=UPI0034DEE073